MSRSSSRSARPFISKCEEHDHVLFNESKRTTRETLRTYVIIALFSSIVSVVITLVLHRLMQSQWPPTMKNNVRNLPGLSVPPLGPIQKPFMPDYKYWSSSNHSYEAWMDLFPKGKGFVSLRNMEEAGPVPDFVSEASTDGTGRFCVAAFHQLHCIYLMYKEFTLALKGELSEASGHAIHCYDYLRVSILCSADTTLEPFRSRFDGMTPGKSVDGFGSNHQCRNFDEVFAWAEKFRYNDDEDAERFEG